MKKLLLLCMLVTSVVFAQNNQSQLAYQYYQNGEYDKAILLYKELNKKNISTAYYSPYISCLISNENYKEAEKIASKMVKKYPKSLNYKVDFGFLQKKNGKSKKAKKTYQSAIDILSKQTSQAISLGNAFIMRKEYVWAEKTYLKAQELNPSYPFQMQMANVYKQMGDTEKMIESYLLLIASFPNQKQSVKNNLQIFLNNDGIESTKNYNTLKKQLLKFVQKEKSGTDFSDMLIWLFMQNHQFELAFLQAKAIDKRMKEEGERIFDLADIFLDNSYYNLAIDAFDYIIKKGKENTFYIDAHINKLFAYNQMIEKDRNTKDKEELNQLYLDIIAKLGKNRNTILLLSNYAHFKAFYQHNLLEAAEILDQAMLIPYLNKSDLAECKLEYADIMLLSGKVWTSILYYSQVEKSFKENLLGHEAKLRRAKIAYFQGDFEWAQAQLDVLKASTSKLIANDAMKLSLLITDNLGLDTSEVPMQTYARAELLFFQNKFSESIITLDSILNIYKGHSLTDEILFKKSEIYLKNEEIEKAIAMLEKIETEFFYDILADDAIFTLAEIYQKKIKDKEKAKALYEKILLEYKGSIYSSLARKRFRKLRGDNLEEKQTL
ncbi:MAG: tetratricopeptide repeat protein [Flavobacteriales bacterium]|nr:tetratricopeptide repeat protein [Flavobacteriales bacterium]